MTDLELLRQQVRDAVEPFTWTDDVLQDVLNRCQGDVNLASAQVWTWRAGDSALQHFRYKLSDGTMIDRVGTPQECREMVAMYREMALQTPGAETVEVEWTTAFHHRPGRRHRC